MENNKYDLIIIGSGPSGLTAGLYAGRYKLKTLVIGQMNGGLMIESHKICNFPTEQEITGMTLTEKIKANALSQNIDLKNAEVKDIQKDGNSFIVKLSNEKEYLAKTVLLAIGTTHRKLELENEQKLLGRGISYCATCDGMFYKDKVVAVVGGNDSALISALYLGDIAKKVYLIHRGPKLRGEPVWIEKINQNPKIEVILETNIKKLISEEKLEKIELDKSYQSESSLAVDGLFIEIGHAPKPYDFFDKLNIELNEQNYIKVKSNQKTSCLGIWASGDITTNSNNFKQIITACSEGAIAAENIFHYVQSLD